MGSSVVLYISGSESLSFFSLSCNEPGSESDGTLQAVQEAMAGYAQHLRSENKELSVNVDDIEYIFAPEGKKPTLSDLLKSKPPSLPASPAVSSTEGGGAPKLVDASSVLDMNAPLNDLQATETDKSLYGFVVNALKHAGLDKKFTPVVAKSVTIGAEPATPPEVKKDRAFGSPGRTEVRPLAFSPHDSTASPSGASPSATVGGAQGVGAGVAPLNFEEMDLGSPLPAEALTETAVKRPEFDFKVSLDGVSRLTKARLEKCIPELLKFFKGHPRLTATHDAFEKAYEPENPYHVTGRMKKILSAMLIAEKLSLAIDQRVAQAPQEQEKLNQAFNDIVAKGYDAFQSEFDALLKAVETSLLAAPSPSSTPAPAAPAPAATPPAATTPLSAPAARAATPATSAAASPAAPTPASGEKRKGTVAAARALFEANEEPAPGSTPPRKLTAEEEKERAAREEEQRAAEEAEEKERRRKEKKAAKKERKRAAKAEEKAAAEKAAAEKAAAQEAFGEMQQNLQETWDEKTQQHFDLNWQLKGAVETLRDALISKAEALPIEQRPDSFRAIPQEFAVRLANTNAALMLVLDFEDLCKNLPELDKLSEGLRGDIIRAKNLFDGLKIKQENPITDPSLNPEQYLGDMKKKFGPIFSSMRELIEKAKREVAEAEERARKEKEAAEEAERKAAVEREAKEKVELETEEALGEAKKGFEEVLSDEEYKSKIAGFRIYGVAKECKGKLLARVNALPIQERATQFRLLPQEFRQRLSLSIEARRALVDFEPLRQMSVERGGLNSELIAEFQGLNLEKKDPIVDASLEVERCSEVLLRSNGIVSSMREAIQAKSELEEAERARKQQEAAEEAAREAEAERIRQEQETAEREQTEAIAAAKQKAETVVGQFKSMADPMGITVGEQAQTPDAYTQAQFQQINSKPREEQLGAYEKFSTRVEGYINQLQDCYVHYQAAEAKLKALIQSNQDFKEFLQEQFDKAKLNDAVKGEGENRIAQRVDLYSNKIIPYVEGELARRRAELAREQEAQERKVREAEEAALKQANKEARDELLTAFRELQGLFQQVDKGTVSLKAAVQEIGQKPLAEQAAAYKALTEQVRADIKSNEQLLADYKLFKAMYELLQEEYEKDNAALEFIEENYQTLYAEVKGSQVDDKTRGEAYKNITLTIRERLHERAERLEQENAAELERQKQQAQREREAAEAQQRAEQEAKARQAAAIKEAKTAAYAAWNELKKVLDPIGIMIPETFIFDTNALSQTFDEWLDFVETNVPPEKQANWFLLLNRRMQGVPQAWSLVSKARGEMLSEFDTLREEYQGQAESIETVIQEVTRQILENWNAQGKFRTAETLAALYKKDWAGEFRQQLRRQARNPFAENDAKTSGLVAEKRSLDSAGEDRLDALEAEAEEDDEGLRAAAANEAFNTSDDEANDRDAEDKAAIEAIKARINKFIPICTQICTQICAQMGEGAASFIEKLTASNEKEDVLSYVTSLRPTLMSIASAYIEMQNKALPLSKFGYNKLKNELSGYAIVSDLRSLDNLVTLVMTLPAAVVEHSRVFDKVRLIKRFGIVEPHSFTDLAEGVNRFRADLSTGEVSHPTELQAVQTGFIQLAEERLVQVYDQTCKERGLKPVAAASQARTVTGRAGTQTDATVTLSEEYYGIFCSVRDDVVYNATNSDSNTASEDYYQTFYWLRNCAGHGLRTSVRYFNGGRVQDTLPDEDAMRFVLAYSIVLQLLDDIDAQVKKTPSEAAYGVALGQLNRLKAEFLSEAHSKEYDNHLFDLLNHNYDVLGGIYDSVSKTVEYARQKEELVPLWLELDGARRDKAVDSSDEDEPKGTREEGEPVINQAEALISDLETSWEEGRFDSVSQELSEVTVVIPVYGASDKTISVLDLLENTSQWLDHYASLKASKLKEAFQTVAYKTVPGQQVELEEEDEDKSLSKSVAKQLDADLPSFKEAYSAVLNQCRREIVKATDMATLFGHLIVARELSVCARAANPKEQNRHFTALFCILKDPTTPLGGMVGSTYVRQNFEKDMKMGISHARLEARVRIGQWMFGNRVAEENDQDQFGAWVREVEANKPGVVFAANTVEAMQAIANRNTSNTAVLTGKIHPIVEQIRAVNVKGHTPPAETWDTFVSRWKELLRMAQGKYSYEYRASLVKDAKKGLVETAKSEKIKQEKQQYVCIYAAVCYLCDDAGENPVKRHALMTQVSAALQLRSTVAVALGSGPLAGIGGSHPYSPYSYDHLLKQEEQKDYVVKRVMAWADALEGVLPSPTNSSISVLIRDQVEWIEGYADKHVASVDRFGVTQALQLPEGEVLRPSVRSSLLGVVLQLLERAAQPAHFAKFSSGTFNVSSYVEKNTSVPQEWQGVAKTMIAQLDGIFVRERIGLAYFQMAKDFAEKHGKIQEKLDEVVLKQPKYDAVTMAEKAKAEIHSNLLDSLRTQAGEFALASKKERKHVYQQPYALAAHDLSGRNRYGVNDYVEPGQIIKFLAKERPSYPTTDRPIVDADLGAIVKKIESFTDLLQRAMQQKLQDNNDQFADTTKRYVGTSLLAVLVPKIRDDESLSIGDRYLQLEKIVDMLGDPQSELGRCFVVEKARFTDAYLQKRSEIFDPRHGYQDAALYKRALHLKAMELALDVEETGKAVTETHRKTAEKNLGLSSQHIINLVRAREILMSNQGGEQPISIEGMGFYQRLVEKSFVKRAEKRLVQREKWLSEMLRLRHWLRTHVESDLSGYNLQTSGQPLDNCMLRFSDTNGAHGLLIEILDNWIATANKPDDEAGVNLLLRYRRFVMAMDDLRVDTLQQMKIGLGKMIEVLELESLPHKKTLLSQCQQMEKDVDGFLSRLAAVFTIEDFYVLVADIYEWLQKNPNCPLVSSSEDALRTSADVFKATVIEPIEHGRDPALRLPKGESELVVFADRARLGGFKPRDVSSSVNGSAKSGQPGAESEHSLRPPQRQQPKKQSRREGASPGTNSASAFRGKPKGGPESVDVELVATAEGKNEENQEGGLAAGAIGGPNYNPFA